MQADASFYERLLDHLEEGVYFTDPNRVITYWNAGAERITGYAAAEVVGRSCSQNLLMHVNEQGVRLCDEACPLAAALADGISREAELYLHHKDGHRVPVQVRASAIRDASGQIMGAVAVFTDNTADADMAQRIAELQKLAMFDPLTAVGNRRYAQTALRVRFNELRRYGWGFGLLFIDIDRFKAVNDTYGHEVGDQALRVVARTLASNVRSSDVVARWGGEEFVVIVANVTEDALRAIANKLRLLVEKSSFPAGSQSVHVTVSIGATIAHPGDTPETLLGRADGLMYRSKALGRNRVSCGSGT